MRLDISKEVEARLTAKAKEQGVSIEVLLERLISDIDLPVARSNGTAPEIPAWHLGACGSLHRRDMYDDLG
jgi:hypothetical protein